MSALPAGCKSNFSHLMLSKLGFFSSFYCIGRVKDSIENICLVKLIPPNKKKVTV